jgi:hypothetical protein
MTVLVRHDPRQHIKEMSSNSFFIFLGKVDAEARVASPISEKGKVDVGSPNYLTKICGISIPPH